MVIHIILIFILSFLSTGFISSYFPLDRESEVNGVLGNASKQNYDSMLLDDNSKFLTNKYTPDQINDIIYRLYQEIQDSNSTQIGHDHDIAILIDLICSNESIETAVEACDIVTELPNEDNN